MRAGKLLLAAFCLLATTTCLAAESDDAAFSPAETPTTAADAASDPAATLVTYALDLLGVKYRYGGTSPKSGLDCSGFVGYVFGHAAGLALPHSAYAMSREGVKVLPSQLQPGDLVFFKTLRRAFSHVGIYLGDDKFIHAANPREGVEISDLKDRYWAKHFTGARRIDLPAPSLAAPPQ